MERRTADEVVAEIGTNMDRFTRARHLVSWAKICPAITRGRRAQERADGVWEQVAPDYLDRGCQGGEPDAEDVSGHTVPASVATDRTQQGNAGGRALDLTIVYVLLRDGGTYRDLGPTHRKEARDARDAIRRNLGNGCNAWIGTWPERSPTRGRRRRLQHRQDGGNQFWRCGHREPVRQ